MKVLPVRYKFVTCMLGRSLVAEIDAALCFASFPGREDGQHLNDLLNIYASAAPCDVLECEDLVVKALNGEDVGEQLRVVLDGPEFSVAVWEQLRKIPFGQVATYAEVAKAIGRPTASRAVAMACSRNHIAVVVPCHRVIASNGSLSGFGWGVDNKKMLLDREGFKKFSL